MWIKDNDVFKHRIILNGRYIYNPTDEQLKAAGYVWVAPEHEQEDWADKELFVTAVYTLIPAEVITQVMNSPETMRDAVLGMMYLTTGAAPGNMIDMGDERLIQWLAMSNLTVDDVKRRMMEIENA